jgi:pyruvate dehydrogenase E1 component
MAVIIDRGMRDLLVEQQDVFYYVTLMNENYAQPDLPAGAEEGVIRGAYKFGSYGDGAPKVTLMGSGAILTEVVKAAQQLAAEGVASEVISVTSWSELARDGLSTTVVPAKAGTQGSQTKEALDSRLRGNDGPYIRELLSGSAAPIIAATDYVRAVPESVRAFLPEGRKYLTLGTDGFGRSDTRAALRAFFGVDAAHIVREARHVGRA